jgi:Xaa-Pro aminopeptidase
LRFGCTCVGTVRQKQLGYISDITRTWAVGGSRDTKHVETYAALYSGFKKGVEMLHPNRGRVDPMNPADAPT